MFEKFRQWLNELNMTPCPQCGCKDDNWVVRDTSGGFVCEADIVCDRCATSVHYWAYGSIMYPETYTGLISYKIALFKDRVKPVYCKLIGRKYYL